MSTPSHLTLPLTVTPEGTLAAAAQDSAEDLACSLRLLMATRPGERASVPGYGTPEELFRADTAALAAAVAEWEPRATGTSVRATGSGDGSVRLAVTTRPGNGSEADQ